MNCPKCYSKIPEGGSFCPECGTRIPAATPAQAGMPPVKNVPEVPVYAPPVYPTPSMPPVTSTPPAYDVPQMSQSVRYTQPVAYSQPAYVPEVAVGQMEYVPPVVEEPAKPKKEKKEKKEKPKKASSGKKSGNAFLCILLAILLLASIGLNIWQWMGDQDAAGKEDSSELQARLDELEKTLEEREAVISELEPAAANYEKIVNEMYGHSVGIGANNFSTNRGMVILSMADKKKQFWLTANWKEPGNVFMDLSSDAASVSYDNETWEVGTTMTVTAQKPGVCVVTFSNSVDSNVFKLLIIVTE